MIIPSTVFSLFIPPLLHPFSGFEAFYHNTLLVHVDDDDDVDIKV
jgi:hypothetical protein